MQIVRRKIGIDASRIVRRLVTHGHTSVGTLEEELKLLSRGQVQQATNGSAVAHANKTPPNSKRGTSVRQAIQRLAAEEFIIQVRDCHFQTWSDAKQDAEVHVLKAEPSSSTKGKVAQQALDSKIDVEMKKRARATLQYLGESYVHAGIKRQISGDDSEHLAKKSRLDDLFGECGPARETLPVSCLNWATNNNANTL